MDVFSKALADLAEKTEPNKAEQDYIKDGMLYCYKCNTALKKFSVMEMFHFRLDNP
jgi:hypothetical protein